MPTAPRPARLRAKEIPPCTPAGDGPPIFSLRRHLGSGSTALYVTSVVALVFSWGGFIEWRLDWMDVWVLVREFYAFQRGAQAGSEIRGSLGQGTARGGWRLSHWISAAAFVVLVTHGAYRLIREIWTNPCAHCRHFQADM